jgi:serine/threonine protein kinase
MEMDLPSITIPYKGPEPRCQDEETHRHYSEYGFPEVLVGDVYSHYKVVRKLGYGGFSTVWLAVDLRFLPLLSSLIIDPTLLWH